MCNAGARVESQAWLREARTVPAAKLYCAQLHRRPPLAPHLNLLRPQVWEGRGQQVGHIPAGGRQGTQRLIGGRQSQASRSLGRGCGRVVPPSSAAAWRGSHGFLELRSAGRFACRLLRAQGQLWSGAWHTVHPDMCSLSPSKNTVCTRQGTAWLPRATHCCTNAALEG